MCGLEIQPETRAGLEIPRKPQGGIWRDAATFVNDLRNTRHRNVEIERQPIHAELKRLHELCAQNFAGMDGTKRPSDLSHVRPRPSERTAALPRMRLSHVPPFPAIRASMAHRNHALEI